MLRTRRHPEAFTLIELLVTIAIIGLLVGLVVVGGMKMKESAQTSQTRAILAGLSGVAADYEVATRTPIAHDLSNTAVFDWATAKQRNVPGASGAAVISTSSTDPEDIANVYIERFVWAAQKHSNSATGIARVGAGRLVDLDDDGFLEIRDAWDNSIAYAAVNLHPAGDDFLPARTSPFFASPGPDGAWGEPRSRSEFASEPAWNAYLASDEYEQSKDNLYSFDIDRTAAVVGN